MKDTKSSSGGTGFVGLLTIVFITLKLCNVIKWSWWWVLSPIWVVASISLIFLAIGAFLIWLARPKTPEEKVAAACRNMARSIQKNR